MASLEELNNLVKTQQEKINQLERKVIENQADLIQLEKVLSTKFETLEIALQEERTKVSYLQEEARKERLQQNLLTLELVEIPGGKLMMGGVKEITLKPFLMGKYPVTQAQWEAVMGNNPSYFQGNNRPVEQVSWQEAKEFCQKLSKTTGRKYQLPSESQWEYACSALTSTNYFFGDDEKELYQYAWFANNSDGQSHPVGEKLPNPWGLYDILGNVWEWCEDDWREGYNHIPVKRIAYVNKSNIKCLRGGAWNSPGNICRRDIRNWDGVLSRYYFVGLRVVMLPGSL